MESNIVAWICLISMEPNIGNQVFSLMSIINKLLEY